MRSLAKEKALRQGWRVGDYVETIDNKKRPHIVLKITAIGERYVLARIVRSSVPWTRAEFLFTWPLDCRPFRRARMRGGLP